MLFSGDKRKISFYVRELLSDEPLILDTETTGLGYDDEVLELCIIDCDSSVLFESYFNPHNCSVDDGAYRVHGLSSKYLSQFPVIDDYYDDVNSLLFNRSVIIYNSGFDVRLLRQSFREEISFFNTSFFCAMEICSAYFGATNRHGTRSLVNSVRAAGIDFRGRPHTAKADCFATLDCLQWIADQNKPVG